MSESNNTVIELPKKHTLRKRLRDKSQDQKAAVILSMATILMITVVVNQWLSGNQTRSQDNQRGIASFESQDPKKNIQWEHELALQLAVEKGLSQAALAEKPTLRDELVFGTLQGRYGVKILNGSITSLEFLESQNGEEPLKIGDTEAFINKYKSVWAHGFSQVRLKEAKMGHEIFQVLNDKMVIVGTMDVNRDSQGRLLHLDFRAE